MKEILLDLMCELNPDEVNDRAQQLSSTIKQADEIVRDEAMSAFEMQNNLFGEQDEPEATELPLEDLAHEIHEAGLTERVLAVIDQPPSKPSKRKGKYTPEPGQE